MRRTTKRLLGFMLAFAAYQRYRADDREQHKTKYRRVKHGVKVKTVQKKCKREYCGTAQKQKGNT